MNKDIIFAEDAVVENHAGVPVRARLGGRLGLFFAAREGFRRVTIVERVLVLLFNWQFK